MKRWKEGVQETGRNITLRSDVQFGEEKMYRSERVTEVKQIHKFVKKHDLASTMNRKC